MFYGAITADGKLSYSNAGQEPPLVVRTDSTEWLEEGGPVLGLLSIATYNYATVPLAKGDLVVVCSDGVTEARNLDGDEFGRDRLVEALKGRHGSKPEIALEHVLGAVKHFSQGAAQGDDITLLVLRYKGAKG
jgi:sigma-B regulation protein RsbU (phosphoserine phosphatase)